MHKVILKTGSTWVWTQDLPVERELEPMSYQRWAGKGCLLYHHHYSLNNNSNNNDPLNFWNFQFCWKYQLGNAENAKRPLHLLTNKRCIWWKNFFLYQKNSLLHFLTFVVTSSLAPTVFAWKDCLQMFDAQSGGFVLIQKFFSHQQQQNFFSLDLTSPNFQISK